MTTFVIKSVITPGWVVGSVNHFEHGQQNILGHSRSLYNPIDQVLVKTGSFHFIPAKPTPISWFFRALTFLRHHS